MTPEFLRKAIKATGTVTMQHENGKVYYADCLGKMQINGEWVEAVMYHQIIPFGWYCRAIDDFDKFKYLETTVAVGLR